MQNYDYVLQLCSIVLQLDILSQWGFFTVWSKEERSQVVPLTLSPQRPLWSNAKTKQEAEAEESCSCFASHSEDGKWPRSPSKFPITLQKKRHRYWCQWNYCNAPYHVSLSRIQAAHVGFKGIMIILLKESAINVFGLFFTMLIREIQRVGQWFWHSLFVFIINLTYKTETPNSISRVGRSRNFSGS